MFSGIVIFVFELKSLFLVSVALFISLSLCEDNIMRQLLPLIAHRNHNLRKKKIFLGRDCKVF